MPDTETQRQPIGPTQSMDPTLRQPSAADLLNNLGPESHPPSPSPSSSSSSSLTPSTSALSALSTFPEALSQPDLRSVLHAVGVQPPDPLSDAQGWPLGTSLVGVIDPGNDPVDERLFAYCIQTAEGRRERRPPKCLTLSFRRVLPNELPNHEESDLDGVTGTKSKASTSRPATYPLPPEGQPRAAIRQGFVIEDGPDTRNWEIDGKYVWLSDGHEKLVSLLQGMQYTLDDHNEFRRREERLKWNYYVNVRNARKARLQFGSSRWVPEVGVPGRKLVVPLEGLTDSRTTLIPLHTIRETIISEAQQRISGLVNPTRLAISNFQRTIEDGTQTRLGRALWEKAVNGDAFLLAKNVARTYGEMWELHQERVRKELDEEREIERKNARGGERA